MKVALLISGFIRNYKSNIAYIKEEILKKFPNTDIYLHITKDENVKDKYFNQIKKEDIDIISNELNPISTIIEYDSSFSSNKATNRVINHWNKLFKLNTLKKIEEKAKKFKYDLVIRHRLDLSIKTKNIFNIQNSKSIIIPKDSKIDKSKLININDRYLSDALSFGSSYKMDLYFEIYNNLESLIEKYGNISETLLFNYLNDFDIKYELLDIDYAFTLSKCNTFAICGDSGSGKSTLSNILKNTFQDSFALEGDRYHKWERYDKNWKDVTHLNPDANFISKMHQDVFDLKIGNHIYQVDYDHVNGKFTEKQLINPSNNLIVCGLHSLYNFNSNIYDLKIYMDTQEELKNKWKILRDVKKRGYAIDKVVEEIKKRNNDYKLYIDPQKDKADLIIKFFCLNKIDIYDFNHDDLISLKLYIKNTFHIENILNDFERFNLNYNISTLDEFIEITFEKYEKNDFISNSLLVSYDNFYDYIIYIILRLN